VHLYCSSLWETPVLLYGTKELAQKYKDDFPRSLAGAPMLLPAGLSNLRRLLDGWFAERGLQIDVVGEFDDAATLRLFGDIGHGLFPVGAALAAEVEGLTGAVCIGELTGLHERFYVISTERRVRRADTKLLLDQAGQRRLEPLLRGRAQ
jgi:LysR family transcriptional activator of nhaA